MVKWLTLLAINPWSHCKFVNGKTWRRYFMITKKLHLPYFFRWWVLTLNRLKGQSDEHEHCSQVQLCISPQLSLQHILLNNILSLSLLLHQGKAWSHQLVDQHPAGSCLFRGSTMHNCPRTQPNKLSAHQCWTKCSSLLFWQHSSIIKDWREVSSGLSMEVRSLKLKLMFPMRCLTYLSLF